MFTKKILEVYYKLIKKEYKEKKLRKKGQFLKELLKISRLLENVV